MAKRIHYSRLIEIMSRTHADGSPKTFDFVYVKEDGQLKTYKGAKMTSFHASGDTVNIVPSGELKPKKFKRILILKLNNNIVYL